MCASNEAEQRCLPWQLVVVDLVAEAQEKIKIIKSVREGVMHWRCPL